ncbi:MAG: potassium channel family protein [Pseudomonadota bacterium]
MFEIPNSYWITGAVTAMLTVVCVLLHYEGLRVLSDMLPKPKHHDRRRMILLILSLLALHVVEIWIFGFAYFTLLQDPAFGSIEGLEALTLVDSVYYSAMVFTTVGFGDLYPTGAVRVMTAMEGITGLTMITWSASYTFVEMSKVWNERK